MIPLDHLQQSLRNHGKSIAVYTWPVYTWPNTPTEWYSNRFYRQVLQCLLDFIQEHRSKGKTLIKQQKHLEGPRSKFDWLTSCCLGRNRLAFNCVLLPSHNSRKVGPTTGETKEMASPWLGCKPPPWESMKVVVTHRNLHSNLKANPTSLGSRAKAQLNRRQRVGSAPGHVARKGRPWDSTLSGRDPLGAASGLGRKFLILLSCHCNIIKKCISMYLYITLTLLTVLQVGAGNRNTLRSATVIVAVEQCNKTSGDLSSWSVAWAQTPLGWGLHLETLTNLRWFLHWFLMSWLSGSAKPCARTNIGNGAWHTNRFPLCHPEKIRQCSSHQNPCIYSKVPLCMRMR